MYVISLYIGPENTHLLRKGKHHCTADLLFDWFKLLCLSLIDKIFTSSAQSKPVKQEVSCTVILPLTK